MFPIRLIGQEGEPCEVKAVFGKTAEVSFDVGAIGSSINIVNSKLEVCNDYLHPLYELLSRMKTLD